MLTSKTKIIIAVIFAVIFITGIGAGVLAGTLMRRSSPDNGNNDTALHNTIESDDASQETLPAEYPDNNADNKPAVNVSPEDVTLGRENPENEEKATGNSENESIPADSSALVTDALRETIPGEYGERTYAIPKINSDKQGVEEFNKKMYDELYAVCNKTSSASPSDSSRLISGMEYHWEHSGDIVSIIVITNNSEFFYPECYVYNFSLEQGKELGKDEVIAEAGYTNELFNEKLRETVRKVSDDFLSADPDRSDTADYYNTVISDTLKDSCINEAKPFFNSHGELCATAKIFSFGGADMYIHTVNISLASDCCYGSCINNP